jgi:hypothetical protein
MGIYKITWIIVIEVYIQTAICTYELTPLKIKKPASTEELLQNIIIVKL